MLIETRLKEPGEFVWEQKTGPKYPLGEEISSEENHGGGEQWGGRVSGGGGEAGVEQAQWLSSRKWDGSVYLQGCTRYTAGKIRGRGWRGEAESGQGGRRAEREGRTGLSIPLRLRAGK